MQYLGFGEFVFRLPDGKEIGRAGNLREMEDILPNIPDESVFFHATHNHFSSWLMARAEIMLASKLKPVKISDFEKYWRRQTISGFHHSGAPDGASKRDHHRI